MFYFGDFCWCKSYGFPKKILECIKWFQVLISLLPCQVTKLSRYFNFPKINKIVSIKNKAILLLINCLRIFNREYILPSGYPLVMFSWFCFQLFQFLVPQFPFASFFLVVLHHKRYHVWSHTIGSLIINENF